jgi:hypothetical protein
MTTVDLTNPQNLNMYAYVSNDPINKTDSLGLACDFGVFSGGCSDGGVELKVPIQQFRQDVAEGQFAWALFMWMSAGELLLAGKYLGPLAIPAANAGAGWGQQVFNTATDKAVANAAANPANQLAGTTEQTQGTEVTSTSNGAQGTEVVPRGLGLGRF